MEERSAMMEMPKYRSHKTVWALKIKALKPQDTGDDEWDGSYVMTPEEPEYGPIRLDAAYCEKHEPQVGGYFVVYPDGYKSFSPAGAFESGYTKL